MAKIVIVEITIPDRALAQHILIAVNVGLQANRDLLLQGLEWNTKIISGPHQLEYKS